MGKVYLNYLSGSRVWSCNNCNAHLANHEELISKQFTGRFGKAYLFNTVTNVCVGKPEDRSLITGLHTVVELYCSSCYSYLGWKYIVAFEDTQKYKEGKFIIEKSQMYKSES